MGAAPIQNSFIFRELQWGSPPESFIQKCWLVSEIQSFVVENYFLMPFSLWNCAFLTIFDLKALYFWNQSIFLNEIFRRASSLRFTINEGIVDGCGPSLMPAITLGEMNLISTKFSSKMDMAPVWCLHSTPIFGSNWYFTKETFPSVSQNTTVIVKTNNTKKLK